MVRDIRTGDAEFSGDPRAVGFVGAAQRRLAFAGLFRLRFLRGRGGLRIGDQLFDLLSAFVADLFVEIRAVLFLDDASAFLTNRLVELRTVPFAGC